MEEPEVIEEPEPMTADYMVLTERTGRYYVVVASFVDQDLALSAARIA